MISVVVPVYNEEERIAQTLASLLAQDYTLPYEVIVVDSGSTDRTAEIVRRFPVELIGAPRGKLQARKIGIQKSNGHIIAAVDGDSLYATGWLRLLTRHFAAEDVVAVSGPRSYNDDQSKLLNFGMAWTYGVAPRPHLMTGSNSAFLTSAYYRIGGFRLVNELDPSLLQKEEEFDFGDRLAAIGKYVYERQAICYTSARRWRHDNKHAQERARGERF